ncbi:MAG: VOC family protein, partial [Chromatiales bacterium]|nr:VOC family protein [Chromatiales bacterium]
MQLAKPCIDVGLFTNQRDAQLLFWQEKVGLEFDHLAKLGKGVHQLRHHMNGSILKINHARATLANNASPSGFQELLIARPDITTPTQLSDPDDNIVTLVPVGYLGVS